MDVYVDVDGGAGAALGCWWVVMSWVYSQQWAGGSATVTGEVSRLPDGCAKLLPASLDSLDH